MAPPVPFRRTGIALMTLSQSLVSANLSAKTLRVDTSMDNVPVGDQCTLRLAIKSINQASYSHPGCIQSGFNTPWGASDRIVFDSSVSTVALGQTAALSVYKTLTIDGNNGNGKVIIDGNQNGRVLQVSNDLTELTLKDTRIQNGSSTGQGGCIFQVYDTQINLLDSTITNCTSGFHGGGVYVNSTASFRAERSVISGNSADNNGGGIYITVGGTAHLMDSTVSGNIALGDGGGAAIKGSGTVRIRRTTVSGNTAYVGGGLAALLGGKLTVTNSTISGNTATHKAGGMYSDNQGNMSLTNSTITNNTANIWGGVHIRPGTRMRMRNTILAGNDSSGSRYDFSYDGTVTITMDHSLLGDSVKNNFQSFGTFVPGPGNLTATSDGTHPSPIGALLSGLRSNGGPTRTHALVDGSPAIDAASSIFCEDIVYDIAGVDQREEPRDMGRCDIGAFEYQHPTCYVIKDDGKAVVFCI